MTDLQRLDKEITGLRAKLKWDHVDHETIKERIKALEVRRQEIIASGVLV